MNFSEILEKTRLENLRRLRDRAIAANLLAHSLTGDNRRRAFAVKHRAGGRAAELGAAKVTEIIGSGTSTFCGVLFAREIGGGRIHLPLDARLSEGARCALLSQTGKTAGVQRKREMVYRAAA